MSERSRILDGERRAEIGALLRRRRADLDPRMFGLPVTARRRSRGLLREEVASLAGVSTTWYTYLEQGRAIRPSPQVVDSLTTVLRLSRDEHRYLRLLVFGQSSPTSTPTSESEQHDVVPGLVRLMAGSEHPFYAGNADGEVLFANPATATWYTDFTGPHGFTNMVMWLLTAPEAKERIVDWEADTRDVVGHLRWQYASRMGEESTQKVIAALSSASAEFRVWWDEQHIMGPRTRVRTIAHPDLGMRSYHLATLRVADDSAVAYVAHVPVEALA
jgi:transcriptional regulator with XRE-family HTH domain